MAKTIIVDAAVAKRMMGIVEHCSYCSVLDEDNGVFVAGFDKKADNIMGRMWDCYSFLDEAKHVDGAWHCVVEDESEQDFNDLMFHAYFQRDEDEAFRQVMYHTIFTDECYTMVLNELKGLTETAVWYEDEGKEALDNAIALMEARNNALSAFVYEYISGVDSRFENGWFDDLVDLIISQDW